MLLYQALVEALLSSGRLIPATAQPESPASMGSFTNLSPSSTVDTQVSPTIGEMVTVKTRDEDFYYDCRIFLVGLAHNRYVVLNAVVSGLGGLSFGYDQCVIADVLVMKIFNARWPLTPFEEGLMSINVSRLTSILISCLIFTLGSLLQSLAQSLTHNRRRALSTLSPLYISEIRPAELAIVFGVVVGFVWNILLGKVIPGSASWRIPLSVQLVPGIILIVGCIFLPASPRLLMLQAKPNEAFATLVRRRLCFPDLPEVEAQEDGLVQVEFVEMRVEATMILSAEWSGINVLLYYGPILIQTLQLPSDISLLISGVSCFHPSRLFSSLSYLFYLGRRPLLRSGIIFMSFSHLTVALLVSHSIATWTSVGRSRRLSRCRSVDCIPLPVRDKGVALSTASVWVNNLIELTTIHSSTFTLFAMASFLA
ncbi:MFS monosaccharide transporter [Lentinula raphanica]|nr:MFS monosaccharide transporter [Lentinula raphanica]